MDDKVSPPSIFPMLSLFSQLFMFPQVNIAS